MSEERIKEIAALVAGATEGPWDVVREDLGDDDSWWVPYELVARNRKLVSSDGGFAPDVNWESMDQVFADTAFIAESRTIVPELLGVLKAERERAERAEALLRLLEDVHDCACDVMAAAYEPYAISVGTGRLTVAATSLEKLGAAIKKHEQARAVLSTMQEEEADNAANKNKV